MPHTAQPAACAPRSDSRARRHVARCNSRGPLGSRHDRAVGDEPRAVEHAAIAAVAALQLLRSPIRAEKEIKMRRALTVLIPSVLAAVLLAACGSSSSTTSSSTAAAAAPSSQATTAPASGASGASVKVAHNSTLGTTILVDSQGMTLYHLSGEQTGHFICSTSSCVAIWHPLTVSAGASPSGTSGLGTVKRPDGTEQVTYNGEPLYTFAQDSSEGDAKGQGLKDVGTWSAVTTASSSEAPGSTSTTTTTSTSHGGY